MTKLIICLGAGGVGKTTTSATLGLLGKKLGLKTLVVTIDPAKRLADVMPDAMILDQGKAWDDLILRVSPSKDIAEKIFSNRFYRYLSREMAGSHEFVACETVYHLAKEHDYDWIVLDTPPAKHAVDFLDAPHRVLSFLEQPALAQLLIQLVGKTGGMAGKILNRFVPGEFLAELSIFMLAFTDLYPPLIKRTREFQQLLASKEVVYTIVSTAKVPALESAISLQKALSDRQLEVGAWIFNQMTQKVTIPDTLLDDEFAKRIKRVLRRHNEQADLDKNHLKIVEVMIKKGQGLVYLPKVRQDAESLVILTELLRSIQTEYWESI